MIAMIADTNADFNVVSMDWQEFLEFMKRSWEPGQHMALVGPTGQGKSNFVGGLLPIRKYVVVFDAKGGDSTLKKLERFGFEHSDWPPSKELRRRMEDGNPARLILGGRVRRTTDLPKLRAQIRLALRDIFDEGGWTVYSDELQIISDRRMMNLGASVERILIAARDRGVSHVGSFQRPANVPKSSHQMSTWFVVFYTRDSDVVATLAEMAGRTRAEMQGFVRGLPDYCVLVFTNNPRKPIIVTKARLLT